MLQTTKLYRDGKNILVSFCQKKTLLKVSLLKRSSTLRNLQFVLIKLQYLTLS